MAYLYTHVEVSWNGGTSGTIYLNGDFPWNHPASYWGISYGNPQLHHGHRTAWHMQYRSKAGVFSLGLSGRGPQGTSHTSSAQPLCTSRFLHMADWRNLFGNPMEILENSMKVPQKDQSIWFNMDILYKFLYWKCINRIQQVCQVLVHLHTFPVCRFSTVQIASVVHDGPWKMISAWNKEKMPTFMIVAHQVMWNKEKMPTSMVVAHQLMWVKQL